MSLSLIDAYNNKVLTDSSLKFMPKVCRCGQDLEISDSLTTLRCSNKNCSSYTVSRSQRICDRLGINLSKDDLLNLIDEIGIVSPYQILEIDNLRYIGRVSYTIIENADTVANKVSDIKNIEVDISEVLSWCGIDSIAKIANQIAYGFNSFDEFFIELERAQVSFLNERLGVKVPETCILTHKIYNEILSIKDELFYAESLLKIKTHTKRLFIAFNDNCGRYINKTEVLRYLNDTFDYVFVHTELVNDRTDILIKHLDQSNYKYRNARLINERSIAEKVNSHEIDLGDADKFIDGELKPLGHKIYIDSIDNLINRLKLLSKDGEVQ